MNYLIVVAHPDDEVLGAGATIHKLIDEGNSVAVCTTMLPQERIFPKHSLRIRRKQWEFWV